MIGSATRSITARRGDSWPTPLAPPRETASTADRSTTSWILTVTLWACVLTEKVAFPGNVEVTLPILWVMIALLVTTGRAQIDPWRLIGFAILAVVMLVGQLAAADQRVFSFEAILLALALYAIFVFVVPFGREEVIKLIHRFQWLALFIAAMVCLDWIFQFAGFSMPSLDRIIPSAHLYQYYNYEQPLFWKSAYMKPNGLFMLETSHTSQLLAMALLFEICLFRRLWMIVVLACVQLSTFGGTGILLVLASTPALLFYIRGRRLVMVLTLAAAIAAAVSQTPIWPLFAKRTAELRPDAGPSSGNGRFIEPYRFLAATMSQDMETLLMGIGPGNGKLAQGISRQLVTPPLVKSVTEYGLITALIWMLFIHGSVIWSRAPGIVAVAVLIQYDFLNGSLLIPLHVAYCYLLAGIFGGATDEAAR